MEEVGRPYKANEDEKREESGGKRSIRHLLAGRVGSLPVRLPNWLTLSFENSIIFYYRWLRAPSLTADCEEMKLIINYHCPLMEFVKLLITDRDSTEDGGIY